MNAGLASGAPEVLYLVQNYHKRAMDAIKSPTPNVNCDVILIRPQMSEHEFCQQNNDYKWKEVCIMNFISFLKKEERIETSTVLGKDKTILVLLMVHVCKLALIKQLSSFFFFFLFNSIKEIGKGHHYCCLCMTEFTM